MLNIDKELKLLNPTKTFEDNLKYIIEAFVQFYGESKREHIIQTFTNMSFIGYMTPSDLSAKIFDIKKRLTKELLVDTLKKANLDESDKSIEKYFGLHPNFEHEELINLESYIKLCQQLRKRIIDRNQIQKTVQFLRSLNLPVSENNVINLILKKQFPDLDVLVKLYLDSKQKYHEKISVFKPYEKYSSNCKKLELALIEKYTSILINEFQNIIPKSELKYYKKYRKFKPVTENYLGIDFNLVPTVAAFSTESERILNNLQEKQWRKDSIISDRKKFLKNVYNINAETIKEQNKYNNKFPDISLVDRIVTKRRNLRKKMLDEYYSSLGEYQKYRKKLDSKRLVNKEDGFDSSIYELKLTFMCPNITRREKAMPYSVICVNIPAFETEYLDANIIHELNHAYELTIADIFNFSILFRCGWDYAESYIKSMAEVSFEVDETKRDYELFNEIINELISQKISSILVDNNHYIFSDSESIKIKEVTSYERMKFLVSDFFDTYFNEIIESRSQGNLDIILNKVGKENFDLLNDLVQEFYQNFPEFKTYSMIEEVMEDDNMENTRIFKDIVSKRNEILENMKAYSQSREL